MDEYYVRTGSVPQGSPSPGGRLRGGTMDHYAVCSCRCMAFSLSAW